MPILETPADRLLQYKTIYRLEEIYPQFTFIEMPERALMDYLVVYECRATMFLEIKTRKESMAQIKNYGGLMLKQRKIAEALNLATALQVQSYFLWTFEDGDGTIVRANAKDLIKLEGHEPPRRRNYRGLACDSEPVVYLDWDRHLEIVE
jgi:hypothetical protein